MDALPVRRIRFRFLADEWLLITSGSLTLNALWRGAPNTDPSVRNVVGLTVESELRVYLNRFQPRWSLVNTLVHELFHVAESERYAGVLEELKAIAVGDAAEYLLDELNLVQHASP